MHTQARVLPIRTPHAPDHRRTRILVVFCYFPEIREPVRLPNEVPNALAPILLAGAFDRHRCDVRIHNEVSAGFIEVFDPDLLEWPDMVVFSGLTTTLDRMLQISAYVKTVNRSAITVAGGIAARAFRRYAAPLFDYLCVGDIEEIRDVIVDAYGESHVAEVMNPRYDLATWLGPRVAYVESSRNCNFRCSFCSLTGDGHRYAPQGVDYLRRQITGLGKRELLLFADNQFHGGDRQFFLDRIALLKELRATGHFRYWSAFVTNTFFWDEDNIRLAVESGCFSMFVGVESFDEVWLKSVNKTQNSRHSQVELIEKACNAGILFQYGMVFDPTERTIASMHRELLLISENPAIPAPNFIFMAIPLPGTPFFHDRCQRGLLLPNTRVRDLEGSTVAMRTLDPVEDVAHFLKTGKNFKGYRRRFLGHQARFLHRYRHSLSAAQSAASTLCLGTTVAPAIMSNPRNLFVRRHPRTHISSTDRLDCVYTPRRPVDAKYRWQFQPTMITDAGGNLNEALVDDVLDTRFEQRPAGT